jgi:hypothetical protein
VTYREAVFADDEDRAGFLGPVARYRRGFGLCRGRFPVVVSGHASMCHHTDIKRTYRFDAAVITPIFDRRLLGLAPSFETEVGRRERVSQSAGRLI